MTLPPDRNHLYSLIIAVYPDPDPDPDRDQDQTKPLTSDWRLGEITVDWVDFTREKSLDKEMSSPASSSRSSGSKKKVVAKYTPGAGTGTSCTPYPTTSKHTITHSDNLSLQPLLAHFPGPNPLDSSVASGLTQVGRGVVHLFRHAPPASLISSLESHPVGETSGGSNEGGEWTGERAEGEDGSLIAILAVPAWMRPADFLEFIGGWGTCLEGVRMIR